MVQMVYTASGDATLGSAASWMAEEFPDIWKAVYTRHIEVPGNYVGPKALAVSLGSGIAQVKMGMSRVANTASIAGVLARHNYPTYYVSAALAEAIGHSHAPKNMTWAEMHWPFDGVVFMLPRGFLREPGGGDVPIIGAVCYMPDKPVAIPGVKGAVSSRVVSPRVDVFWTTTAELTAMEDCCFPMDALLEPDPSWIQNATINTCKEFGADPSRLSPASFSSRIAGLVANFMLVKESRKELVEPGRNTGKRLKSGVPIHTPTMLGPRYEILIRKPKTTPGAHYTELGWRAGYWGQRRIGVGRGEVRRVLVDPYIAYSSGLVDGARSVEVSDTSGPEAK